MKLKMITPLRCLILTFLLSTGGVELLSSDGTNGLVEALEEAAPPITPPNGLAILDASILSNENVPKQLTTSTPTLSSTSIPALNSTATPMPNSTSIPTNTTGPEDPKGINKSGLEPWVIGLISLLSLSVLIIPLVVYLFYFRTRNTTPQLTNRSILESRTPTSSIHPSPTNNPSSISTSSIQSVRSASLSARRKPVQSTRSVGKTPTSRTSLRGSSPKRL